MDEFVLKYMEKHGLVTFFVVFVSLVSWGIYKIHTKPDKVYDDYKPVQELRTEIFMKCLDKLPKSPEVLNTSGNDLDEMIDSCESAAYSQSLRCTNCDRDKGE